MINFFRKIRKKLADENKFIMYSRYAIGETALVVFGILIALQINDWNDQKNARKAERQLLKSFRSEVLQNQNILRTYLRWHESSQKTMQELNEVIKPDAIEIPPDKLNSYIAALLWIPEYRPKDGVINSIIPSGKLSLIQNEKLSNLITWWNTALDNYYNASQIKKDLIVQNTQPFLF